MNILDTRSGEIVEVDFDPEALGERVAAGETLSELEHGFYQSWVREQWTAAKEDAGIAKQLEADWRDLLVWLHGMTDRIGSLDLTYADGKGVKISRAANYTLDIKGDVLRKRLAQMRLKHPNIENIIKWTAEVSHTNYQALPELVKRQLDDVITVKPAAAQVEVKGESY